jgi:hypothetical protein
MATLALWAGPALAGEVSIGLGDAQLRYDDARWHVSASAGRIEFTPHGSEMRMIDAVELRLLQDSGPCRESALKSFDVGPYETERLTAAPIEVGGIAGERFEARTGCRNATPIGVVACLKTGGRVYLLQSLNPDCRGRNLFSGIDPLAEIGGGMTFATQER